MGCSVFGSKGKMEESSEYYVCGMCGKVMEGEMCSECPVLGDEENEVSFEELLISEVSRRRELWDPSIELKLRTPAITAKSWAAIDEALGILPGTAKKRWKTLRDVYARKLAEEKKYVPSGSGASQTSTVKWKYFASLDFLRPTIGYRKTSTNILLSQPSSSKVSAMDNNDDHQSRCSSSHSDASSIQSAQTLAKTGLKKRRMSSTGSSDTGFENSLLEAIEKSAPSLPLMDEVGAFCKFLEMRLRNLDIRTYRRMSHSIMKTMMDLESELPDPQKFHTSSSAGEIHSMGISRN